jgi:formylglycine-generating enzyme required for sulfatase activity
MNALIIALAVGVGIALIGFLTARDDGSAGRPRWPARYPAGPRRDIYGGVRKCLVAVVIAAALMSRPVTEAEWDAACRRHRQPGSDETEART